MCICFVTLTQFAPHVEMRDSQKQEKKYHERKRVRERCRDKKKSVFLYRMP